MLVLTNPNTSLCIIAISYISAKAQSMRPCDHQYSRGRRALHFINMLFTTVSNTIWNYFSFKNIKHKFCGKIQFECFVMKGMLCGNRHSKQIKFQFFFPQLYQS